jgi:hypothetical protein
LIVGIGEPSSLNSRETRLEFRKNSLDLRKTKQRQPLVTRAESVRRHRGPQQALQAHRDHALEIDLRDETETRFGIAWL